MLKLYYAASSCALATHIVLEEVGADYSTQRIEFAKEQQKSPEFLKINPKGRVPALVTDRGILTETPAMLVYVAQSFPAAGLAPMADAFAFARMQSFNSYLCSHLHVAHAHRMRGHRWVDADDAHSIAAMRRKVPETVGGAFEMIERDMLEGPWVMGDTYTICDPYLFTLAQWMEKDGVDLARVPRVVDHRHRMSERLAVKKAIAEETA
ncbi:glutathione S-transferase family protein [Reyranella sp. MMS21-HV4-11]|uniref:Glutathione S-transferase family protein n=1 Tax=Reyranella humidisoli TaxID=2849149 RepID=A0ABS6ICT1_9HYPH|nr:glutathione S-transferase family protein [Reyranella sp. MMS21-HV4-11]MBU8872416.1 glutathione S-transferase family protein [Reyranella sp. MMS21-HV4-11]